MISHVHRWLRAIRYGRARGCARGGGRASGVRLEAVSRVENLEGEVEGSVGASVARLRGMIRIKA